LSKIKTMNQTGLIYQSGGPQSGEVYFGRQAYVWRRPKKNKRLLKLAGNFLVGAGLTAALLLIAPFAFWEIKYQFSRLGQKTISQVAHNSQFSQIIKLSDLKMLNPVDPYFSLVIPKIGVNSQVQANIPVDEKKNYASALKKGVAHAAGSGLPGENNSIYLFGHSSDYVWNLGNSRAVFYLLKELAPGDQINLFYHDRRFIYQVAEKKITAPGDLSFLKPRTGEEKLILQTCWPLGTNWKRLVVLADRV